MGVDGLAAGSDHHEQAGFNAARRQYPHPAPAGPAPVPVPVLVLVLVLGLVPVPVLVLGLVLALVLVLQTAEGFLLTFSDYEFWLPFCM